jgi:hypothetical protein
MDIVISIVAALSGRSASWYSSRARLVAASDSSFRSIAAAASE